MVHTGKELPCFQAHQVLKGTATKIKSLGDVRYSTEKYKHACLWNINPNNSYQLLKGAILSIYISSCLTRFATVFVKKERNKKSQFVKTVYTSYDGWEVRRKLDT